MIFDTTKLRELVVKRNRAIENLNNVLIECEKQFNHLGFCGDVHKPITVDLNEYMQLGYGSFDKAKKNRRRVGLFVVWTYRPELQPVILTESSIETRCLAVGKLSELYNIILHRLTYDKSGDLVW